MTKCSFGTLRERDMDLLFLEAFATDKEFVKKIIDVAGLPKGDFLVLDVQVSKTELDLGESDITVVVEIDGCRYGLLIEDKIDAPAMREQYERYKKRGDIAVERGDYQEYRIFIFSPSRYREENNEAKKYDYYISYEKLMGYFAEKDDLMSKVRCLQLEAAIKKAKSPANVTLNADANAFYVSYMKYQKENYPVLDLRTKETSNGYWAHYATALGKVYILHKIQEGYVDLTFPNTIEQINVFRAIASWLRKRGMDKIIAKETGKSMSLRIEVPRLNIKVAFEETSEKDLRVCFDVISELNELAGFLGMAKAAVDI